ncbi:MAG: alcohol dehydrogenase catalytic domain-containing protein [Pseudonocardiaceae bacterium]
MRAIVTQPNNTTQPVAYQDWPTPVPGDDQVLVRIRCAALNRNDAMIVAARDELGGPRVLGSDGAGEIVEVGPGVTDHRIGDEVVVLPSLHWGAAEDVPGADFEILGYPTQGTHAEYVCLPAANVFAKPTELDWRQAAALPLAGLTAWRALVTRGQLRMGDRVLVTGASGGVASYLVQIAALSGAQVWVTSSRNKAIRQAVGIGAAGGVVRAGDWSAELRERSGGPFHLVLDSSGADWTALLRLLHPGGRLVSLGRTVCHQASFDVHALFAGQVSVLGTSMGSPREFAALLDHVRRYSWRPVVDSVFPMGDAEAAYSRLDSAERFGKVVLVAPVD